MNVQPKWLTLCALALAVCSTSALLGQNEPAATKTPFTTDIIPGIRQLPPAPDMPHSMADLQAIQARAEAVAHDALPAIVNIVIFGDDPGEGSGVIVSKDGYVLTAGHVSGIPGTRIGFRLSNGTLVTGVSLGADGQVDSGLCKITTPGNYAFMPMGSTLKMSPGQWVMTMGHPGGWQDGRDPVVRLGKVLNVKLPSERNTEWSITTDCTMIMGDSGGPVFDLDGRVVAINSRIGVQSTSNVHVPVDTYEETWTRLADSERWGYGSLLGRLASGPEGPQAKPRATLNIKAHDDATGVVVTGVTPFKAGDKAGLLPEDVISKMNGQIVKSLQDLAAALSKHAPGETVTLDLLRDSKTVQVKLVLDGTTASSNTTVETSLSKSSPELKAAFASAARKASQSTVRILVEDEGTKEVAERELPAAYGTIVRSDGFILTKSSEVVGHPKIFVKIAGKELPAKVVGVRDSYDLAMLKIDATNLTPAALADTSSPAGTKPMTEVAPFQTSRNQVRALARPSGPIPEVAPIRAATAGIVPVNVGELVITPDAGASETEGLDPKNYGVISVPRRTIPFSSGVLGVQLDDSSRPLGALITEVFPMSGAGRAGIKPGDVVTAMDGTQVSSHQALQALIRKHYPADTITLSITRGIEQLSLQVQLGDTILATPEDMEMSILSGQVNTRSSDFQAVFQHDTVLDPKDMGGPLVDLEGRVIGINIARAGRTETYAIPSDLLTERWLTSMEDGSFAPKAKK